MNERFKLSMQTILIFTLTLFIGLGAVTATVFYSHRQNRQIMQELMNEKVARVNDAFLRMAIRAQVIVSNIEHTQGYADDFSYIASLLVDGYETVLNIVIAPGGIVSAVYPLEGNESKLGSDLLSPISALYSETFMAKQTGEMVLGGPFLTSRGEKMLVGRMAVYITNEETAQEEFWGIVSVGLSHSRILYETGLSDLAIMGFKYEVWYTNLKTSDVHLVTSSGHYIYDTMPSSNYTEIALNVLNTRWHFLIMSSYSWYNLPLTWALVLTALGFSVLTTGWVHTYFELKKARSRVGAITNIDLLTGIHNRAHFYYEAQRQLGRVKRTGSTSHLILINLGSLKEINDEFGYASGDILLREVCDRIGQTLRPYDLFARFGGEEFIVLVTDTGKEGVTILAERIRVAIADEPIEMVGVCMKTEASIGISEAAPENELDKAIEYAEAAVYLAKTEKNEKAMYL